jgi:DNA repair ATPase RecN
MRLESFTVRNVMRISDLDVDPGTNSLILIGGKNGQGKTSALKALLMTLCGKRGMDWPEVALKDGSASGGCEVKLSLAADGSDNDAFPDMEHITIRRTWERQRDGSVNESLEIADERGSLAEAGGPLVRPEGG